MRILLMSIILFLASCSDRECNKSCKAGLVINEDTCECDCWFENRWNLTKISDSFCAEIGSYLSTYSEGPDLDTFTIAFPSVINDLNPRHRVMVRHKECPKSGGQHESPDSYYASYSHGDSLILDWFDAPDCSFDYQSAMENALHDFRYRLKFNGFLPKGSESDTIYAHIDYLSWAGEKVHESKQFIMTKVK